MKKLFVFVLVLTAIGCAAIADLSKEDPSIAATPTIQPVSPVIATYAEAVRLDMQEQADRFSAAGTQDLSGYGYEACVVDSDCLSGVRVCVAGVKPNSPAMPGYCVPK